VWSLSEGIPPNCGVGTDQHPWVSLNECWSDRSSLWWSSESSPSKNAAPYGLTIQEIVTNPFLMLWGIGVAPAVGNDWIPQCSFNFSNLTLLCVNCTCFTLLVLINPCICDGTVGMIVWCCFSNLLHLSNRASCASAFTEQCEMILSSKGAWHTTECKNVVCRICLCLGGKKSSKHERVLLCNLDSFFCALHNYINWEISVAVQRALWR